MTNNKGKVFERIYKVVQTIPKGKVATYGQVALAAGNPRWARVVGYALHCNPNPSEIPCYRVVNREGRVSSAFAFGGENVQVELLKREGVGFIDEVTVDMKAFAVKHLPPCDML
ncbi:MAG: MGMT family protein [Clostridia bacterium]|nr:MGMT family protein [Clostridia bacterium]